MGAIKGPKRRSPTTILTSQYLYSLMTAIQPKCGSPPVFHQQSPALGTLPS